MPSVRGCESGVGKVLKQVRFVAVGAMRYDIVTTLQTQNRLRRRPPADLRGFCIEVTVQNLFKGTVKHALN